MGSDKTEIYVSTDIEADGPIPGPHSMLSFASAAYAADKTLVSKFSANLAVLPEAAPHPRTMAWWGNFPDAWQTCRQDIRSPEQVMPEYLVWLQQLGDPYVASAYDEDGRVGIDWGVYGAPETFLIDKDGVILHKHISPMTEQVWQRDFLPRINAARGAAE